MGWSQPLKRPVEVGESVLCLLVIDMPLAEDVLHIALTSGPRPPLAGVFPRAGLRIILKRSRSVLRWAFTSSAEPS
jgi:hypothetical protein